jgi:hypothetical protein
MVMSGLKLFFLCVVTLLLCAACGEIYGGLPWAFAGIAIGAPLDVVFVVIWILASSLAEQEARDRYGP